MRVLLLAAALTCARAFDRDVQAVKSVKGGHGGFHYQGGDISRFYSNNTNQNVYSGSHTASAAVEVGVCYIEVPTASLVRDKVHVPAGNGSRPDMSRIRTCCQGYERNIHNYRICDPVCTQECVNGLCIAPDTCSCYPDHVRNQAGLCVATCPIGCQNGHCDGGECMCKEGFKLDAGGRFCVPHCRNNCGGIGTCTGTNTCTCPGGYQPTPDGSCGISGGCGKCDNGDCVSSTECRCRSGYRKDSQGLCVPYCSMPCSINERCAAPDVCSLISGPSHPAGPQQTNSQNPYGLGQNNTYYVPQQGPNYPLYPHNQNKPQHLNVTQPYYPNQGGYYHSNTSQPQPSYPHQHPIHSQQGSDYPQRNPNQQQGSYYPYSPQQGSHYPYQPQQGSNYPPTNPNLPNQGTNYPTQPQQGPYPQTNPTQTQSGFGHPDPYPIYQNQGSNYPPYPHSQNTTNNQPNQEFTPYFNQPNQGSFQPIGQSINVTYPQYPLHPENQLGANRTSPNQPGQQYPNNQVPGTYNQVYNPQYPSQGGNQPNYHTSNGYHSQEHSGGQSSFNQYDQTQQSSLCSQPCTNGICIDVNRCRCNPGYVTDEMDSTGNTCRPHCPGGCPNGYCAAPYSCQCAEGYQRDTSVKGRPSCVRRIRRALHQLIFSIPDPADQ